MPSFQENSLIIERFRLAIVQIDDTIRRCVVFLYAGGSTTKRPVGTGFLVKMEQPTVPAAKAVYLVTAKHVVERVRQSGHELYARVHAFGPTEMALYTGALADLDRRERGGEKVDFLHILEALKRETPESVLAYGEWVKKNLSSIPEGAQFVDIGKMGDWLFHDDPNVDAAVLPWRPPFILDCWEFPIKNALTPTLISEEGIGLGEDVFVVGLFSRRVGQSRNIPIIRVGNIVAMPEEPIETAMGLQTAYLVELLSIGGLSGSPVFTYLGGVRRKFQSGGEMTVEARAGAVHLLGLIHGHWNLPSGDRVDVAHDAMDGGERVNMGIAIVVPIYLVLEILDYPKLRDARESAVK